MTEGSKAGVSQDDLRRTAGHAKAKTTEKYDRDEVEAQRRSMESRASYRAKNKA